MLFLREHHVVYEDEPHQLNQQLVVRFVQHIVDVFSHVLSKKISKKNECLKRIIRQFILDRVWVQQHLHRDFVGLPVFVDLCSP